MRSKPKAYAIGVVVLEILCCILIYLCCVYIRRRRCGHKLRDVFWGSKDSLGGGGLKLGADSLVLVFFPYSALDAFKVIKTRGLRCTACLREFNKDDETLRLMPKCGHVFHPLCLIDPCSVSCPCCNVVFGSNQPSLKSEGDENEPVAIDIDTAPVNIEAEGQGKDSRIIEAEAENGTRDEIEAGAEIKSKTIVVSEGTVKAMDMIIEIGLLEEKVMTKLPEDIMEKIISQAKLVSSTGEVYSRSRYLW